MTNNDCLIMYNGLQVVRQPAFAEIKNFENKERYIFHAKFIAAVSWNKRHLEPIIESLRDAEKLNDEYKEYLKQRDDILIHYAKKDADGNPQQRIQIIDRVERRSYNVPMLHDKNSEVSKKIAKLEDTNKGIIDDRKKLEEEFQALLKEETNFIPKKIPLSMIPDGQDAEAMDAIIYMIEDFDEDPPVNKKTKK